MDDDPILRAFAEVHLTTETAAVHLAEDGEAALAAMAQVKPDIVILDLEMPRLDGFEVLVRARANADFAHTPIIVATGREDVAAIDRAFEAGATSFVTKPLNWRLISYQIRYAYRAHRTEATLREELARAASTLEAALGHQRVA